MQYNRENGSTMTQKEVSVHSETMEKRYRDVCDLHTKKSDRSATGGSVIDN